MIFIILALIFFAIWYGTDKTLKDRFNIFLKWSTLAIIVFFVLFDLNMMLETTRFIEVRTASDIGLLVSSYDNSTGNTTETRMFGVQTEDSINVISYHYAEYAVWPVLIWVMPFLFIVVAGFMLYQAAIVIYEDHINGKR